MKRLIKFLRLMCITCMIYFLPVCMNTITAAEADTAGTGIQEADIKYGYGSSVANLSASTRTEIEKKLTKAWKNQSTSVDLSKYNINITEIKELYYSILFENPSYFYVRNYFSWSNGSTGIVCNVYPEYTFGSETAAYITQYETQINKIVKSIPSTMSELEKALYINEYLVRVCDYGDPDDEYAHCAYSAIMTGNPVCQGYALAYKDIADRVGLECHYVSSENLSHAWNIVKINEKYYYIDSTFNDPICNMLGYSSHSYFLLSKASMKSSMHDTTDWVISGSEVTSSVKTGTDYDDYMWSDVNSPYVYYGGYWYGFDENGNFNKYKCDGTDFKVIKKIDTLTNSYNGVILKAGVLYYSDYYGIHYYDIINKVKGDTYIRTGLKGINADKAGNALVRLTDDDKTYSFSNYLLRTSIKISQAVVRFKDGSTVLPSDTAIVYSYDGNEKKPNVKITLGGRTLVKGIDYKLTYSDNIRCGTATVTATGIGEYSGKITKEFVIDTNGICGDNATWSFDEKTGILTIGGKGAMYNYDSPKNTPWYQFGSKIKKVVVGKKITKIGNHAFNGFKGLKYVTGCVALKTIGYKAFANCKKLTAIRLGENIKTISKKSFYGDSALKSVYIKKSIFSTCRKLLINAGVPSGASFIKY